LLQETGLISASGQWRGGKRRLVSLGDLLDRGPGVRRVLDLLLRLKSEAETAGGSVDLVMGNHEVMVMSGDRRYVTAEDYASFAPDDTPRERKTTYRNYRKLNAGLTESENRVNFEKSFPPGFNGLVDAFSTRGRYGRWLSRSPFLLKLGDTLFVHGGISHSLLDSSLEKINLSGSKELLEYLRVAESLHKQGVLPWTLPTWDIPAYLRERYQTWKRRNSTRSRPAGQPPWLGAAERLVTLDRSFIFQPSSPIWYRGTSVCNPNSESVVLEKLLRQFDVKRVVVGHTPTKSRKVTSRMQGQVIMLDTGMLRSFYHGTPAALIIRGTTTQVHYLGRKEPALVEAETPRMLAQPASLTDQELEHFLISAPIRTGHSGSQQAEIQNNSEQLVELQQQDLQLKASLKPIQADAFTGSVGAQTSALHSLRNEAAYRLDRLLKLYLVPVAVHRQYRNARVALQYVIPDTFTEADRLRQKIAMDGYCSLSSQLQLSRVFNALTGNDPDASPVYTRADKRLWLSEFGQAFGEQLELPGSVATEPLEVSRLLADRLAALTPQRLEQTLGDLLAPAQIEAILKRRDRLLETAGF